MLFYELAFVIVLYTTLLEKLWNSKESFLTVGVSAISAIDL